MLRQPAVAGRFYPAERAACEHLLRQFLESFQPQPCSGGIAPHAGWVYSGQAAALVLACVAAAKPETVVLFGAVHGPDRNPASMYPAGAWSTPFGEVPIDEQLAEAMSRADLVVPAPGEHDGEHAIEVQVPILAFVAPGVRIVPISVRPGPEAVTVGRWCAAAAARTGKRVAFVGSTDLTHYGPLFGFESHGRGSGGAQWARDVNDRRMVTLIAQMRASDVIAEAALHHNACGPGAIAATLSAMTAIGATQYVELLHMCSADVHPDDLANSVGYEAGIFVQPGTGADVPRETAS